MNGTQNEEGAGHNPKTSHTYADGREDARQDAPKRVMRLGYISVASIVSVCALIIAIVALTMSVQTRQTQSQFGSESSVATPPAASPLPSPVQSMPAAGKTMKLNAGSTPVAARTPWVDPSPIRSAVLDVKIDRELNRKLLHDPAFQRYPIDASSNNSWITLRGSVPTRQLRARAESIAKSIPGVKGVSDQLTVQPIG